MGVMRGKWECMAGLAVAGLLAGALPGIAQQAQPGAGDPGTSQSSSPQAGTPQAGTPEPGAPEPGTPPQPAKPAGDSSAAGSDDNAFPLAKSEAAQQKAQDAAEKESNDFPEAKSEAAQRDADSGAPAPGAGQPAGEPYSSSATRAKGLDLLGNSDAPATDGAGHFVNNPALTKEDIRVGKFYLSQGNYPGAYSRLKEATEVGPGNVEAVYLLAEAARKDSHLDEAVTNYKLYLQVEPKGKYAKDARKALDEMAGK